MFAARPAIFACSLFSDLCSLISISLADTNILRQVQFVMKGGAVVVDTFHTPAN